VTCMFPCGRRSGDGLNICQVHASMTQRKRLKQLHWDKIRTVPENSIWSKTPKVRRHQMLPMLAQVPQILLSYFA